MRLWIDQIDEFRRKICYKVNAEPVRVNQTDANGVTTTQEYWVNCNPLTFRIFGFIDDTGVETCRPGGGWGFMRSIQQCFYSRYFRGHGLKFQTVFLPNGMFGSVFGASWNRNDNGILNLSGLASYLVLILSKIPGTNFFPALYGDAIFALTAVILGRYQSPCTFWLKGTWNPHDAYEKWRFFMHFVALFILFNLSLPSKDYFNWYNG